MGARSGGGASGGMGSRSRSGGGGELTITIGEYQMRQGNSLVKFEQVEQIKLPEKFRKEIEDEDYILTEGKIFNSQTYYGDQRWTVANKKVMDDNDQWLIGNWDTVKVGERKTKIKFKNSDQMWDKMVKFKEDTNIRIFANP